MVDERKPKVFLSHSSRDKSFVRELDRALQAYGIETFLDERDIRIGENIPNRVYEEIQAATYVCYVISSSSINSAWVRDELSKASMLKKERRNVIVLPILIERTEIPVSVINKRYADFTLESEKPIYERAEFRRLLEAMGVDPVRYEPNCLLDSGVLLDLADASSQLILRLVEIRTRAEQLRQEWSDRERRPGLVLLYQRLLGDSSRLLGDIEAYQDIRERLRPYLKGTATGESIERLGNHLALFLGSTTELPVDPHNVEYMLRSMDLLVSESSFLEYSISSALMALLYFGREGRRGT